ncbi:beta-lactamase family protein [Pseudomonas fuscovaginae UPB0736]|uniref:serine hydrolase domain-containing protein n=1 Tax=Pseudomonas asplenii TaxID=53407 RepID=UPI000309451F|nr:serine hydrolase domain-containing protein [Pseudomonas fuscovaginae]UUQ64430.1 beta-lactamase family protein [Pseudomonas fuscovaginae UPB0736]
MNAPQHLHAINAADLCVRLDQVFATALCEKRIVGAIAIVAQHGQVLYRRAHGLADREAARPLQEDSLFRLASVTKPIVTVAVLRLIASGHMRLDDPITRWLPDFTPKLADGSAPVLTVHQLLSHTAGLSYVLSEEFGTCYHTLGISDGLDLVDFDLQENLRRLAAAPLLYAPGSAWRYSLSLDVLGAAIERVTGQALAQAVEQLVTAPLGMFDTGFVSSQPERLATPYANASPEPLRMSDNLDVPMPEGFGVSVRFAPSRIFDPQAFPSAGAGMYGSADDLLRLLETIRNDDVFLPRDLRESMRVAHAGQEAECNGPGWGFGYGGAVLVDPQLAATPQSAGTLKWGGVYGHSWFIDTALGLSVLLLTNTAYEGMAGDLPMAIRDVVYQR